MVSTVGYEGTVGVMKGEGPLTWSIGVVSYSSRPKDSLGAQPGCSDMTQADSLVLAEGPA